MKKINILSYSTLVFIIWSSMPLFLWSQYEYNQSRELTEVITTITFTNEFKASREEINPIIPGVPPNPCPRIRFVPKGNCTWEVQIRGTFGNTNYNALKMDFSTGGPQFTLMQPPPSPQLAGWTDLSSTSQTLEVKNNFSSNIPTVFHRLCDIGFYP